MSAVGLVSKLANIQWPSSFNDMLVQPAGHPQARDDVLFRQVDDEWVVGESR